MRCPHCRTEIRALKRPEECPHCGRPLKNEEGHAIRPMDEDFDGLFEELDERSLGRLKTGTIVVTAVSAIGLLGFLFPPILAIVPIVVVVLQFIWARPLIAGPYARHFGVGRRILTRWISRLGVVTASSFHVSGLVPGVQVLVSPVLFAAICGTSWAYHRFHLRREHNRQPVHVLEKILLVVLALVFLLLIGAIVIVFLLLDGLIGGSPK
jgi:hypothetical protein